MIGTPKPICRHPIENKVTVTLSTAYYLGSNSRGVNRRVFQQNQNIGTRPVLFDSIFHNFD